MGDERKQGGVPTSTFEQKAQFKVLEKMLVAALTCCIFGAVEMYFFRHIWLSAIFIFTILTMLINAVLLKKAKITAEFAALMPILIFCFVYTPASWYTFDGLMGNTPYLTIIFVTVILLTNYRRGTKLLIGLYGVTLMGLTVDWLLRFQGTLPTISVLSTLMAWILVLSLIVLIVGNTQKQSLEYNRMMFDRSIRDALTGLYNRNAMEPILGHLESQYSAHGSDYIAMMFDIDQFKQANDLYGHAKGDAALKMVAARILEVIRETDYALRFGGDEFLVLLPVSAKGDSHQMVDRIGRSVCSITGLEFPVMVSCGSAYRSECADQAAVLALSDQRMYLEKQGRYKSSGVASPGAIPNLQDAVNMKSGGNGEMKQTAMESFWQTFLEETGRDADTQYLECFHFDLNERSANGLLALVLEGKKRATASSLYAFAAEHMELPKPGSLSIVTDWAGAPHCVIETTAVTILPFREVTFELCSREGEDESLESWQRGHTRFFTEDGKALGYEFSEDMPVVFEDFEVIYRT